MRGQHLAAASSTLSSCRRTVRPSLRRAKECQSPPATGHGLSGAADEERIANRIADQEAKLAALLRQREVLIGNA